MLLNLSERCFLSFGNDIIVQGNGIIVSYFDDKTVYFAHINAELMKIEDFIKSLQEIAENHPGIEVNVVRYVDYKTHRSSLLYVYVIDK